jgi:dihydrofolate synthase/folylpolyglutamate synthase
MNYQETLDYLLNSLPMFQRVGASAFRKDLRNTILLCDHLGNPERKFKSIHIAGTNGKGSTSHALAAVFQSAGYKTGLYTSPHLKSFTERIRINGKEIDETSVVDFVSQNKNFLDELKPSFFEMTVGMAFWFFASQKVDIAIVEVGMGGNYDSTNVILPELSVITNISLDHVQFLGDTLPKIAGEKAGIIKSKIPVIISQTQRETTQVFVEKAKSLAAPIVFADQVWTIDRKADEGMNAVYQVAKDNFSRKIEIDLKGDYQKYNLSGILEAIEHLRNAGWELTDKAVKQGLSHVTDLTGLKGRWQQLSSVPLIICDTGHNEDGMKQILAQLKTYTYSTLWMVLGMVKDKDISKILSLLPQDAKYIFCQATLPRAMPAAQLALQAAEFGLSSTAISDINQALEYARKNAASDDLIFVGGSTFVVAEIEGL